MQVQVRIEVPLGALVAGCQRHERWYNCCWTAGIVQAAVEGVG